jgi:hypothetical protein
LVLHFLFFDVFLRQESAKGSGAGWSSQGQGSGKGRGKGGEGWSSQGGGKPSDSGLTGHRGMYGGYPPATSYSQSQWSGTAAPGASAASASAGNWVWQPSYSSAAWWESTSAAPAWQASWQAAPAASTAAAPAWASTAAAPAPGVLSENLESQSLNVLIEVWLILRASIFDRIGFYSRLVFTQSMPCLRFKQKVFQHAVSINTAESVSVCSQVIPGSELSTLLVGPERLGKASTLVET